MYYTTFVGLDVHKDTIAVAVAREGRSEPELLGQVQNNKDALLKLIRRLGVSKEQLAFCYEAGPCGYEIYRFLKELDIYCIVVAPSLVPSKAGDKVKTDRRDARKLARLFRSGELTPVWVPDEEQEALRDLVRSRDDALQDLQRKRHQLGKFLLRTGKRPPAGIKNWTVKHRQWLDGLSFEHIAQKIVLKDYLYALDQAQERLKRLEQEIEALSQDCVHTPVIVALKSLKGIDQLTAATLVAELGDISRFNSPTQLMAYAGLVPSENSSGPRQRKGSITKTGNVHVRRVVVESAWHYRHVPRIGRNLEKRQEGLPEQVKNISWKAQHRLNLKYRKMLGRGKMKQIAVIAVARELLGFIWSVAKEVSNESYRLAG